MRVIEPDQSGSVRGVQRQRITEPVRSLERHLGSRYDELHPVPDFVDEKCLAVKVQQRVQSRVAAKLLHRVKLSVKDNLSKRESSDARSSCTCKQGIDLPGADNGSNRSFRTYLMHGLANKKHDVSWRMMATERWRS